MKAEITIDDQVLRDLEISGSQLEEAVRNALGSLTNPDTGETLYFGSVFVSTVVENPGVAKATYSPPGVKQDVEFGKVEEAAPARVSLGEAPPAVVNRELVNFTLQSAGKESSEPRTVVFGTTGCGKSLA